MVAIDRSLRRQGIPTISFKDLLGLGQAVLKSADFFVKGGQRLLGLGQDLAKYVPNFS